VDALVNIFVALFCELPAIRTKPLPLILGLERYWHWVIGYWAIFADIG